VPAEKGKGATHFVTDFAGSVSDLLGFHRRAVLHKLVELLGID
jgi:hypothetical protein